MNNRKHNAKNPHQGSAKKVLCVCSAGLLRSPTAANVLHSEYGFNTRAAGLVADFALIPVDDVLLYWADEIVCMNIQQSLELRERLDTLSGYGLDYAAPEVIDLDIPDSFSYMDLELQNTIKAHYDKV